MALAATPGAVPGLVSTTHPDASLWYQSVESGVHVERGPGIGRHDRRLFVRARPQRRTPCPRVGRQSPSRSRRHCTYAVGSSPAEDRVADLAGNGIQDIVVENSGSNTVSVLMGKGDGTFKSAVSYATGANPWSLEIGDVNADGKLDIVTCNEPTAR